MYRSRFFITLLLSLTVVVCVGCGLFYYNRNVQSTAVIEEIKILQRAPNKFIDYDTSIGVSSADDLGYVVNDSSISLHYGKKVIDIKKKSLKDPEFMADLKSIGIEFWYHDEDMKITYWGEEIEEWVALH